MGCQRRGWRISRLCHSFRFQSFLTPSEVEQWDFYLSSKNLQWVLTLVVIRLSQLFWFPDLPVSNLWPRHFWVFLCVRFCRMSPSWLQTLPRGSSCHCYSAVVFVVLSWRVSWLFLLCFLVYSLGRAKKHLNTSWGLNLKDYSLISLILLYAGSHGSWKYYHWLLYPPHMVVVRLTTNIIISNVVTEAF